MKFSIYIKKNNSCDFKRFIPIWKYVSTFIIHLISRISLIKKKKEKRSKITWTISTFLSLDLDLSYLVEHSQWEDHLERIVRDQGPPQLERFPIRHYAWTQYRHSIQIEKDDEKRWYRRVHQGPITDPRIGNRSEDFRVLIQRHLDQPLGTYERSIRIRHLDSRFQFPLHHQFRCRRCHFWK